MKSGLIGYLLLGSALFSCGEQREPLLLKANYNIKGVYMEHYQEGDEVQKKNGKYIYLKNLSQNLDTVLDLMREGRPIQICCYGNSITYGFDTDGLDQVAEPYPSCLQGLLKSHYSNLNIEVLNEGHNGWRSDQAFASLERKVINKKPDLVILEFGINDAYSGFGVAKYEEKMLGMIHRLKKAEIKILLLSPTPVDMKDEILQKRLRDYSHCLKNLASRENIAFFHLQAALLERLEKENMPIHELLPDKVHFASDKYCWIAEEIFNVITGSL